MPDGEYVPIADLVHLGAPTVAGREQRQCDLSSDIARLKIALQARYREGHVQGSELRPHAVRTFRASIPKTLGIGPNWVPLEC